MARSFNWNQIIRLDAKDTFVEVMDTMFDRGQVVLNFIQYDKQTNKVIHTGAFFLDFATFLLLEEDLLGGKLAYQIKAERQRQADLAAKNNGRKPFPNYVYMRQGGTTRPNPPRKDGAPMARMLKILPGEKIMFQYEAGKGRQDDKGLIIPEFGTKPELRITVPMTDDDLKKLVIMTSARINAYLSAAYVYHNKADYNAQVVENNRWKNHV